MDPIVTSALIGAGSNFLSSSLGNSSSKSAWRESVAVDRFNYKRRHQWEVQDLKKAGLNPVLSALNGAPSMPGAGQAQVFNPAATAASHVQSALMAKKLGAEINAINAQARRDNASAGVSENIADISSAGASFGEWAGDMTDKVISSAKGMANSKYFQGWKDNIKSKDQKYHGFIFGKPGNKYSY